MKEIQTGSNQAVQPLPRRDPWASFAIHGMPPEVPHPHAEVAPGVPPWIGDSNRGRHRRMRPGWRGILAALGITALALGSCGTPAPAAVPVASPVVFDWSTPPTPKVTPATQRRIEIVDRIPWNVSAPAEWLDRYTASNMVVVSRCSGRAYRCITVRGGKLPGRIVGWAEGNTITIDTAKVARSPYRSASYCKALVAHELGHAGFGLKHKGGRNLMATTIDRMRLSLTAGQRAHLRAR